MIEAIELTSTHRSRGSGGGPVEEVSFDVYPGQVTALLGAPGSGKSTVLRMMVELEPCGGRTLFGGRPYRALRPAVREVGLALNPDAVHPGRTVQAHLQLYSAAGGVPKARIAEVLEVAGLSTQAAVRCGRLDPGQRQRLAIAAALLGDPSALILDEPHALDTHGRSWFHALIRAYAAQGRTVLVAATDPDSLAGTADHVVILRRDDEDGISRVIASRSAAEVFDERRATVVQVRSPQAARLAAALETEGARLATAGPGALQVRGLDRARIGEVAHGAGICLHELSEIGHDDDVFGLRPVPRQKELLPGLSHLDAEDADPMPWTSGVRLISTGTSAAEIEEAGVVEPAAAETASAGAVAAAGVAAAAIAETEAPALVSGQPADQTVAEQPLAEATADIAVGVADQAPAMEIADAVSPAQGPADAVSRTQGRADAVSPAPAELPQGGVAAIAEQGSKTSDRAASSGSPAAADAADAAQPGGQEPQISALSGGAQEAGYVRWPSERHAQQAVDAAEPPQPSAATTTGDASKRTANRAFGTFRRARVKIGDEPEAPFVVEAASETSAPSQPAVPFTVAAAPVAPVDEGMTPWRAVAARAGRQQREQGSVVEAASAEQEASA